MNDKTTLDQLNEQYWIDFSQGQPINGGVAYEAQLRQCNLNLSLDSLKDIDKLLSSIRKDVHAKFASSAKQLTTDQKKVILFKQDGFRKLAMFIGFYTGRVLAKIYKSQTQCLSQQELLQIGAHFISAEVEHSLAIRFIDGSKQQHLQTSKVAKIAHPELFFVYEPMVTRLLGSFDYQIRSIQGQPQVADGLYRAVIERLPQNLVSQVQQTTEPKQMDQSSAVFPAPVSSYLQASSTSQNTPHNAAISQNQQLAGQIPIQATTQQVFQKPIHQLPVQQEAMQSQPMKQAPISQQKPSIEASQLPFQQSAQQPHNIAESTSATKISAGSINAQTENNEYLELLAELDSYMVNQLQGEHEYAQGKKVMHQFDEHARKQGKPTDQLTFSEQHVQARKQGLELINKAVSYGNTTAMIHLAVYYLRGDWLPKNLEKGIELLQNAASFKDPRAMRELSRLYYKGTGVPQDSSKGKYWIEQAAKAGHSEAQKLLDQIMMAQMLVNDHKADNTSDQRYLYFFIGLFVFVLLMMIFL